jgi:ParB family chromosome partitioning protein
MVDENLVRKNISFSEMATLAADYAADPQTSCLEIGQAVSELYASSGSQKRSYIRAFAELHEMLGSELKFPTAIPRNLGLAVRRQIEEGRPGLEELREALTKRPDRNEEAELAILRGFAGGRQMEEILTIETAVGAAERKTAVTTSTGKAKTRFTVTDCDGEIRCVAASCKMELRAAVDFSGYDQPRLEAAVQAFLDVLKG